MVKFILKVHEKFPENPLMELLKICTDKPKICQHIYIKSPRANAQCTIKVKGEGDYCNKHKIK